MLFSFYCTDKPDHGDVRAANREAHLNYIAGFHDQILAAGPLLSDDGKTMIGSLIIMDFPDREAAEAYAAGDPYFTAGLFGNVAVRRWKKVLPED